MYHLVPGPAVPHFAPCDVGVYVPLVPGPAGSATLRDVHLVPDLPGTTKEKDYEMLTRVFFKGRHSKLSLLIWFFSSSTAFL